jgi:predicted DsbA family dithiol-disulfide isomerase
MHEEVKRCKMRVLSRTMLVVIILLIGSGGFPAQKRSRGKEQKPSGMKKMASVDGVAITETQARMEGAADLDSLELQVLRSKATAARNEHDILENALERLIQEMLLRSEAQKRGLSKEELLTREIQPNITEPTAEEIDAFYTENKQRIGKPKEQVLPQISKLLKQRKESELREAFFSRLEKEHQVVRNFEPLRYTVDSSSRPSLGPASAPVQLVLFSDFQCPYCKRFNVTVKEVLKKYGDKVHLVFRQFPLTNIHANAQKAAEASLCAQAQGHFWEMHDLLLQNQGNLRDVELKERANRLGLDLAAFNSCLDSARYGGQIQEDIRAGASAGVEGTPALFINGRFLYGSRPFEDVAAVIDEELKSKK